MDFLIGYIVDKLEEIKEKNNEVVHEEHKQIILTAKNEEAVKDAMKKLGESNE